MANRYLVECTRKPTCDYGTNTYHFKDAEITKIWPNQGVFSTGELLAMQCKAEREGKEEGRAEGQNEAWKLAQKIYRPLCDGGYSVKETSNIFGCDDPLDELTYEKAAEKVKAWEEKYHMLKVGTIVKVVREDFALFGKRGIIVASTNTGCYSVFFRDIGTAAFRQGEIERIAEYDIESLFKLMEESDD